MRNRIKGSTVKQTFAAIAIAAGLAACSGQAPGQAGDTTTQATATAALDPVLAEPRVGDVYAAELTHFSGVDFGAARSPGAEAAYGLMRVIEVSDDRVTLNTETGAWPKARGAVNELRGDQADITWDEEEKIEVYRSELAQLVADEKILEARRM